MIYEVDADPPSVAGKGPDTETLSACAAVVWRGAAGLAPALRATVLAMFKAMGTEAAEPMVTAVSVSIDTILAEPAIGEAFGTRSQEAPDATLRQAVTRLRGLRLQDVSDDVDLTKNFTRSPFLDICEIATSSEPDDQVVAWLVRCGQWACWRLTRGDREALCQLARRHLAVAP